MEIEKSLVSAVEQCLQKEFKTDKNSIPDIQIQKTRKEFTGHFTVVVFPLLKISKKSPEQTGEIIGSCLKSEMDEVIDYNVIKGFLNLSFSFQFWKSFLTSVIEDDNYGFAPPGTGKSLMVEYSSPNTNKPLHLGHLRNNFLGYSISKILEANGNKVQKVQIINDRGIHICKSMLAWKKWGNEETPDSSGLKGDHLAGKYYVLFDQHYKAEVNELMKEGLNKEEAESQSPLMQEARELLKKWEKRDSETIALWKKMNSWVYDGFNDTYEMMGVDFDKLYYESDTYLSGRDLVMKGLEDGICFKKDDGSIWIDLTSEGLDEKILIRKDGTSVYMTQDIGTAVMRFKDFPDLEGLTYVVGNEQDYHFKALFLILKKLGYNWANECQHLSYGMVDLPTGKMKSREGTVVDADDLMKEMVLNAEETAKELGKLEEYNNEEKSKLYETVGLGALKYFILKVDPKKRMLFDPQESIDFNGNTGPFIQYTYARIRSVLRKAVELNHEVRINMSPGEEETILISQIQLFPEIVRSAANEYNPSLIANYVFDLVKLYNHFYQTTPILKGDDNDTISMRLAVSNEVGKVIHKGMNLLGIQVPEQM